MIKIRNESKGKKMKVEFGKGFAQGIFLNYELVDGDSLTGEKRKNGFGSTDR